MRAPYTIRFYSRTMIAALLAIVILCAQWTGLSHRIAHAGLPQSAVSPQIQADNPFDKTAEHSCILFDAAALATGVSTPPYTAALLPGAPVLALWLAFASWHAPLLCHFSSRAPPLA